MRATAFHFAGGAVMMASGRRGSRGGRRPARGESRSQRDRPEALARPARVGRRGDGAAFAKELLRTGGVVGEEKAEAEVSVVWFRNDLRVRDNAVLEAARRCGSEMLPVYCFDPRAYEDSMYGFQKTGEHRAYFVKQAVEDLRRRLRDRGSDLIVRVGQPDEELSKLVTTLLENGIQNVAVFAQKDVTWEETQAEKQIVSAMDRLDANVTVSFLWNSTLLEPAKLPYGALEDIPDVFTAFRKEVESNFDIPPAIPPAEQLPQTPLGMLIKPGKMPELGDDLGVRNLAMPTQAPFSDPKAALDFEGGETAAQSRVEEWIWDTESIKTYKETRNTSGEADVSSKFSVYLASGCLSARDAYWEIKRFERERVANESTYWMVFELLWRDYFRFNSAKDGNSMFSRAGKTKNDFGRWRLNERQKVLLDHWIHGTTGVPFVDANMRELYATG